MRAFIVLLFVDKMQALKGRQAALLAIQRDAEQKLAEARNWGNEGRLHMLLHVVYLRLIRLHMLYTT